MENLSAQADEIEVLSSIYGSDWKTEDERHRSYSLKLCEGNYEITVFIKLPLDYPTNSPPEIEISAPYLSRTQKQEIALYLDDIFLDNLGEAVLYQWAEKIREFLQNLNKINSNANKKETEEVLELQTNKQVDKKVEVPVVKHGLTIQDRKSIFQGHVAEVHSQKDVTNVIDYLMENKKIADATHNITAYRIQMDKGNILQDCNDDGEAQAGRRLLHLLQIVDVTNVLVVVSRWYGGVQLGPDRFRHINNAARQILEQAGYIVKKK
ncbi:hypothetical protein CBL_14648 [Carabus blaptoides fortunei]